MRKGSKFGIQVLKEIGIPTVNFPPSLHTHLGPLSSEGLYKFQSGRARVLKSISVMSIMFGLH
jgi:hypothetical protein